MTVCIAALCQNDEDQAHIVVASDRMVTLGGFIEFEHAVPKMRDASSRAITMVSGDALVGTQVAEEVAGALSGSNPPIAQIAQALAARYEYARRQRVEQHVLRPRCLDMDSFYGNHQTLNPNAVMMLDSQIAQFNLGVELLLAGLDPSGAHIYSVMNPGPPESCHDVIGYAAIGSGTIHALQAFIGFGHSASAGYHQTVFRAYAAKRRAEVAPGVGRDTDMAVVSDAGIHRLTEGELEQLRNMYKSFEASTSLALQEQLEKFRLGEGTQNEDDEDGNNEDSE
jgi:20S proteasome alpha/beta subunit